MPLGIDSALFNLLLGAAVTMASTMVAWAVLHWNQRRIERDRTRRAVAHEVDHIVDSVERLIDLDTGLVKEGSLDEVLITLSPDVLSEDFRQVNKLTTAEVKTIYEFYELTRVLQRKLRRQEDQEEIRGDGVGRIARRIVDKRDEINYHLTRSRLSLFTKWYKERDRRLRAWIRSLRRDR